MNTNHGKKVDGKGCLFKRLTKLKQPRKTALYPENMSLELCYQCPLSLRYYGKLVKYYKRAKGGIM